MTKTYNTWKGGDSMPRGDGTGPMGMGSLTGRGAGICAGFATPGYASQPGFGCGFGAGRGFRRMFYATGLPRWTRFGSQSINGAYISESDEKEVMKNQARVLENQLNDLKKRLAKFEETTE